jgi:hypothetical protein
MSTTQNAVEQLSEDELLGHFETLVARDRRTTTQLLVAIAEIDERKLWAKHACSSMFVFCVKRFHMSEQTAFKRIWAARTVRRFPIVLGMIERGDLHLSAIHLLAKHLTAENSADVLQRARHKSSRDIERLVAALAPRPDVASRVRSLPRTMVEGAQAGSSVASDGVTARSESDSSAAATSVESAADPASTPDPGPIQPRPEESRVGGPVPPPAARPITALSPRRYKIEITVDEETHDKLRSLQDLLGRSQVGRDPAAIISRAIDNLLLQTLKRKAATTDRPQATCDETADAKPQPARDGLATADASQPARESFETAGSSSAATNGSHTASPACGSSPNNPQPRSRSIPAALRRVVWRRDCGRCRYMDGRGRRCHATSNVDFHHKDPFAKGGRHDADNVELRCAAHNQYQADLDFGRGFMDARRTERGAPYIPRGMSRDVGGGV